MIENNEYLHSDRFIPLRNENKSCELRSFVKDYSD